MTYTTDQAIALAREVGAAVMDDYCVYLIYEKEFALFANAVRKQTLLEAAEYLESNEFMTSDYASEIYGEASALRDMAGVE